MIECPFCGLKYLVEELYGLLQYQCLCGAYYIKGIPDCKPRSPVYQLTEVKT